MDSKKEQDPPRWTLIASGIITLLMLGGLLWLGAQAGDAATPVRYQLDVSVGGPKTVVNGQTYTFFVTARSVNGTVNGALVAVGPSGAIRKPNYPLVKHMGTSFWRLNGLKSSAPRTLSFQVKVNAVLPPEAPPDVKRIPWCIGVEAGFGTPAKPPETVLTPGICYVVNL